MLLKAPKYINLKINHVYYLQWYIKKKIWDKCFFSSKIHFHLLKNTPKKIFQLPTTFLNELVILYFYFVLF